MAYGRNRAQRQLVLAQAAVLFFDGRDEDLQEFIDTGALNGGYSAVMPYDPAVSELWQQQWQSLKGGQ